MSVDLSRLICHHRKAAELSQQQLAELSGVGKTLIFDLEHGKMSVRYDNLLKVLATLNITVTFTSPLNDEIGS